MVDHTDYSHYPFESHGPTTLYLSHPNLDYPQKVAYHKISISAEEEK